MPTCRITTVQAEEESSTSRAQATPSSDDGFPIVGVGASAGGLEAFEEFFRHMPATSGLAFVLVQHLDPTHTSILTEILQRSTRMRVEEARDQAVVVPNCVYVIPPNRDMVIFHGALQLSLPAKSARPRMPIDTFLRALAEDQGHNSVGIILSGTGTDGTLGLRAIVGAGGVAIVQEPQTAKYDGMPTSAIKAGYASHVLPVERMAQVLLDGKRAPAVEPVPPAAGALSQLLAVLRSASGIDFSDYKKSTVARRIERRMALHRLDDKASYARHLKEYPPEARLLCKELLINVTCFFRDTEAFNALEHDIVPQMFEGKAPGHVLRVWVAGGSTGEEAFSIAMLLRERMDETRQERKVQIYSTDLDEEAIAVARAGFYLPNVVADVAPERLQRFFVKEDSGYRVKREIREMVVFAVQNVISDPPFTRLDLLSCRNLMIYLEPELQNRLIPRFHYALKPEGVLFLSPSESIGNHPDLFAPLNRKWKLFRALRSVGPLRLAVGGARPSAAGSPGEVDDESAKKPAHAKEAILVELSKRLLLQTYAPASVLITSKGDIVYVHGEIGEYLRPAQGPASLNAIEMAREGLQLELRAAIRAAGNGTPTLGREVQLEINGVPRAVRLSARPLPNADSETGSDLLLVSFQEAPPAAPAPARRARASAGKGTPGADARRIEHLERDLAYTKENLQGTIEEQQSSNEELQSTNEELQSSNEELQSTNEELETSQAELQSVNEELVTVNAELQSNIDELADVQNDLQNLLDNINVGTVFLDLRMRIRRFTREATRVYRLVDSDVGRPLGDIKSDLSHDLCIDARSVLDSLVPIERELRTGAGAWFAACIRPYRTQDNAIAGTVLTFTDITKRVQAEATAAQASRAARGLAERIVDALREPLLVLDAQLTVIAASRSFYRDFRVTPEATVGRPLFELGNRQWDIPALRELLETVLPRDCSFEGFDVQQDFPGLGPRRILVDARRIDETPDGNALILLAMQAMSEQAEPSTGGKETN